MHICDCIETVAATPEHVLGVIVDCHRQQVAVGDCVDPDLVVTSDTTIREFMDAWGWDLVGWRTTAKDLNEWWGLDFSTKQWQKVLVPTRKKTMRDLCKFIAEHTVVDKVLPAQILGKECMPAGAFFAILNKLRDAGVDVSNISPSTLLDEYTRKHVEVFLGPISQLAPNTLPPLVYHHPLQESWSSSFGKALLLLFVSVFVSIFIPWAFIGIVIAGVWLVVANIGLKIASKRHPETADFGSLRTFRELAYLIAGQTASFQSC